MQKISLGGIPLTWTNLNLKKRKPTSKTLWQGGLRALATNTIDWWIKMRYSLDNTVWYPYDTPIPTIGPCVGVLF